jgi:hypothetical protein
MNKDKLVHEIGAMLLEDPEIASEPWQHLVMIAQIQDSRSQLNGFAYEVDGQVTVTSPDNFDIIDKFAALREMMRKEEGEPWQACLVRIDRLSGKISIEFEYDRPEKWLITPANSQKLAEALRPASE